MEHIEFTAVSDGSVIARTESGSRVLSQCDRDIIRLVLEEVKKRFPGAHARLRELYKASEKNVLFFEYLMAKRFIRCNMGTDDILTFDVDGKYLNLEFVNCPLRGDCQDEHVICRPSTNLKLTDALKQVASLYAVGHSPSEIAEILGKSQETVKKQLRKTKEILGLKRVRDIITYDIIYKI